MHSRAVFSWIILLFCTNTLLAQSLDHFQWKNRILLLLATERSIPEVKEQLKLFEGQEQEFKERKLLFLLVTPLDLNVLYGSGKLESSPQKIYEEFKRFGTASEIVLIGLDGSVKLHRDSMLTARELYAVIDAMPMRRSELDRH